MRRATAGILVILLVTLALSTGPVRAQTPSGSYDAQVDGLLAQMSPEERVGQLFLVTYFGPNTGSGSEISQLITDYHVGGVLLSAANENFTDAESVSDQIYLTAAALQTMAAGSTSGEGTQTPEPTPVPTPTPALYVPLFIGVQDNGIGPAIESLRSGTSPLPSSMAIGATWNPEFAEKSGQVVGQELSSLGVNFLVGVSADVVETPQPFTLGDLGVSAFGGEPFWVSQMVSAYVRGVHEGSDRQIAVIVGHFPGYGGADRLATAEVPIVRRSLDQLTQFDLLPFFAATGQAANGYDMADGLLTGHISYRGFQGDNPRVTTRPISLDSQALQVLLKLDNIAGWRNDGGLVVSDSLGVQGVRRFYEPQDTAFRNRRIALDALLAGNDVLYVDQFGSNPPENQAATIEDTIDFFVQQYQDDPAFQARVDDAVRRILRKKLELYRRFDLNGTVIPPEREKDRIGQHGDITFSVAQNAVTLLSPSKADLLASPQSGDRIVIFTDTRPARLCSNCTARPTIPVNALQSAILRLYGPQASAVVQLESIQSFSFEQLSSYLQHGPPTTAPEEATPEPDSLELAVNNADWIVFVMQNVDAAVPSSDAVRQFLAAPSIAPGAQVVVMAMKAPYYLDSTEIGKLAAYYGLYGTSSPFIDVAARALFLGVPLNGASPVSVGGTNYNIVDATSPNPNQIIKLSAHPVQPAQDATATSALAVVKPGDTLQLTTGVILDRNGHPVPDGTPVDFVVNYPKEGLRNPTSVSTINGIATTGLVLDRLGEVEVTVQSGVARQSEILKVIISEAGVTLTLVAPDALPTSTPSPTGTQMITETPPPPPPPPPPPTVNFGDWFVSLLGLMGVSSTAFWYGYKSRNMNQGLLLALPALVSGLIGYNYFALKLPGAEEWYGKLGGIWAASFATWGMALVGLAIAVVLLRRQVKWPPRLLRRRLRRG